jgi:hypothetical protein
MTESTTEKKMYLRNYDYDQSIAYGSSWTVNKAIDYLATFLVNCGDWESREQAFAEFMRVKDLLLQDMKACIEDGSLVINEEYDERSTENDEYELNFDRSSAFPFVFINWAIARKISVPQVFEQYASRKNSDKARYYEGLGVRMSTIHHERCRAIAEMLWSREPGITIAQMARREEVIRYGCEGHEYDTRTISRWLASLKSERPLGRPRKQANQAETAG